MYCVFQYNSHVCSQSVNVRPAISKPDMPHLCTIFPTVVAEPAISVKQRKLPPGIAPPEKIIRGPQDHQFYNCHILPSCIVL